MMDMANTSGGKRCAHDWRIVDTRVDQMYGLDKNPVFDVRCRKCGATQQVKGQAALKALSNRAPFATSLG